MSDEATEAAYDAVVVGGGFYGCAIAAHLAERGLRRILLVERSAELLTCASWANQARVHNGYHYPRSYVTAHRSRVNLPRFLRDYGEAVRTDATSLYAIAQQQSKVTRAQFERFMAEIGAPFDAATPAHAALFNPRLVAAVYQVQEHVFDATALRRHFLHALPACGVALALGTEAALQLESGQAQVALRGGPLPARTVRARWVFNCTYAGFNALLAPLRPGELTPLKHEVTELALVRPPPELQDLNITLMDGPFFSITRFPAEGCHCLTHVRYTPHEFSVDTRGPADPRAQLATPPQTRAHFMVADGARYLPCLRNVVYRRSLFEIKTVLMRREVDDGRPILLRREPGASNLVSVLGGKIDNIYDVLELLDREVLQTASRAAQTRC